MEIDEERFGKPFDPNEYKRKQRNSFIGMVVFLIAFVAAIIIITIVIESNIHSEVLSEQKSTWTASLPSYWGGIIGGAISGILAFLGVFYTIRYYKESDAKKERAAVQPFLLMEIADNDTSAPGYHIDKNNVITDDLGRPLRSAITTSIKNIGNGFANTLVIYTGNNFGGEKYNNVITVGNSTKVNLVIRKDVSEVRFAILYIDSMTNEYIQNYSITKDENNYKIESGYPQFMGDLKVDKRKLKKMYSQKNKKETEKKR